MELNEKQLKAVVQEAVREILAEVRLMPVPSPSAPVTEIVIRSGSSEAVQILGGASVPPSLCPCQCLPPTVSIDDKRKELLQRIQDKTGETQEDLIRRLELRVTSRQLAEEIEKYAKELEIK